LLAALAKAFGQFSDPRLRSLIWRTLGLSLLVLIALAVALWLAATQLSGIEIGWVQTVVDFAAGVGVVVLAWFLFPAAVSLIAQLYLEEVASAVEARHYPALPPPRQQSLTQEVVGGVRFGALALALNIAALPIFVVGFFVPPLNLVVFYGLNGYLLSREYFELVALRRVDAEQARQMRRAYGGRLFVAGVIVAFLLTIPFVNLVAPVIATAFMLHLFEGLQRRASHL
jgi:uncharacterized protein involved in cysteine biosynthesis